MFDRQTLLDKPVMMALLKARIADGKQNNHGRPTAVSVTMSTKTFYDLKLLEFRPLLEHYVMGYKITTDDNMPDKAFMTFDGDGVIVASYDGDGNLTFYA